MKKSKLLNPNSILLIIIIIIIITVIIYILYNKLKKKDSYLLKYNNMRKTNKNLSFINKNYITQLRICGTFPNEGISTIKKNKLGAVFDVRYLWEQNQTIMIQFIETPNSKNFPRTYKGLKLSQVPKYDDNKNLIKYDPLEYKMNNSGDIINNIIEIISERIERIVNLKFKFVPPNYTGPFGKNEPQIKISFNIEGGTHSSIGTNAISKKYEDKKTPNVNFGWFDVGTVLHEFGHIIGMVHEHQSYKAAGNIKFNDFAVMSWAKKTYGYDPKEVRDNILTPLEDFYSNASNYDPESIMMYFIPNSLTTDGKGTRENMRLSKIDVLKMSEMYPPSVKDIEDIEIKDSPQTFYNRVYGESIY